MTEALTDYPLSKVHIQKYIEKFGPLTVDRVSF